MNYQLSIPKNQLAEFCEAHGIRRPEIFGSALRTDFGPESDVDVLVEFARVAFPACWPSLEWRSNYRPCLSLKIDLHTLDDLNRYFCREVLDTAEVQYVYG